MRRFVPGHFVIAARLRFVICGGGGRQGSVGGAAGDGMGLGGCWQFQFPNGDDGRGVLWSKGNRGASETWIGIEPKVGEGGR